MLVRILVCSLVSGMRLAELLHSRRNLRSSGAADEGHWSRRTYPLMVGLHTFVLAWTLLRGDRRPRLGWLLLFMAAQPLRFWVLLALRNRWNTRGAVPRLMSVETHGPYALIRHPNYLVVVLELLALPLAFGLRWLAVAASAINVLLLIPRIREEERALMRFSEYRDHFAHKRRFIPGVF
jgi:methyltransferase